jgi:hypothetical protein
LIIFGHSNQAQLLRLGVEKISGFAAPIKTQTLSMAALLLRRRSALLWRTIQSWMSIHCFPTPCPSQNLLASPATLFRKRRWNLNSPVKQKTPFLPAGKKAL